MAAVLARDDDMPACRIREGDTTWGIEGGNDDPVLRTVEGLSIGYRTERERRDPETGLRRLDEVDLWEISLVTFPMLPQARITAVKAMPGPLPAFPAIRPL